MNYSKKYLILTLDGFVIGHRATKEKAIALALEQAYRREASIEVQKRNAVGKYQYCTMVMNPFKFGGDVSNDN